MLIVLFMHFKSIEIYEICKWKVLVQFNAYTFKYVCKMSNHTDKQFLINLSLSLYTSRLFCFVFFSLNSSSFRSAVLLYFNFYIDCAFQRTHRTLRRHSNNNNNNVGRKIKSIKGEMVPLLSSFLSKSTEHTHTPTHIHTEKKGRRKLWYPTD